MDLIITIGIPGSGKSTAIKERFPNALVVSPDHISYDADGHFDVRRLGKAWKVSYAALFQSLQDGVDTIIFDATNLRPETRGALIAAGRFNNYTVRALFLKTDKEEAKRRNRIRAESGEKDAVPNKVIDRMSRDLVAPNAFDPNEFDDVIVVE